VADIKTKRGIGTMKEKGTGIDWVAFFTANGVIPEQEVKTAPDPIYTRMAKSVMNKMCDGSYYKALASRPAPSNGLTVEDVEGIANTVRPLHISVIGLYDLQEAKRRGVDQMKNAIIAELRREG